MIIPLRALSTQPQFPISQAAAFRSLLVNGPVYVSSSLRISGSSTFHGHMWLPLVTVNCSNYRFTVWATIYCTVAIIVTTGMLFNSIEDVELLSLEQWRNFLLAPRGTLITRFLIHADILLCVCWPCSLFISGRIELLFGSISSNAIVDLSVYLF